MVLICCKGADGKDGSKGQNGTSGRNGQNGQNGSDGGDGTNGSNATNKEISLQCNEQNQLIINGENMKLLLGSSESQIQIMAFGGRGGNGGDGGNGGHGGEGVQGQKATALTRGGDGGEGGNGGNGGNGGRGGDGGNGGNVFITCSQTQTDLFYLVTEANVSGGSKGVGGRKGEKGWYGKGGQGGYQFQGVNGQKGQPSGKLGRDGKYGQDGKAGQDGKHGQCGHLYYRVAETGAVYDSLFNLVMGEIKQIKSDDAIVEPGEKFSINIQLLNNSKMSTPQGCQVKVSLINDPLIIQSSDNIGTFTQAILPGQTFNVPKLFEFEIKQNLQPSINKALNENLNLRFSAVLTRVNGEFKGVSNYEQNIKVEYPVELSYIAGPRSVLDGEEAPVVIGIKNKSTKPLGINHGRLLNLRFYNDSKKGSVQLIPFTPEENQLIEKNNQYPQSQMALDKNNFIVKNENLQEGELLKQMFIPSLQPNQEIFFKCTVKITDPSIQAYEAVNLRFSLDLGYLNDPMNKYQTIQEMNYKLQKGETLQYKEISDVVLVINQEIQRETIVKITEKLKIFGVECDIYNISQYKTFRYRFDPYKTCQKPLQKKAIVIFGNNYQNFQNIQTNAPKTIGYQEIFLAAYQDDSRSYIIGQQKDIKIGRIFNYHALELFRNAAQHDLQQTFPYKENFKISIPDIELTLWQYMKVINGRQENNLDGFVLNESQRPLNMQESEIPDQKKTQARQLNIFDEFQGVEENCDQLESSANNQKKQMKNLEEIVKFYQQNPEQVEGFRNLNTGYRVRQNEFDIINYQYDTKNIILKQIQEVQQTLSKLDPCYNYSSRHYFQYEDQSKEDIFNFLEGFIGKSIKSSGFQYIARGLRKDCSQIVFREKKEEEINNIDDGDIYNILKVIPVAKKVSYINKFNGSDSNLADILFAAIGSDLIAEFLTYTEVNLRTGWNFVKYLNEMKGWKAINDFNFQHLVKDKNKFILQKFLVMIKSVFQVITESLTLPLKLISCCCCCLPVPSITVHDVCKSITKKVESSISVCSGASDKVEDTIKNKLSNQKNFQAKLDIIHRPDRTYSSNTTLLSNQPSCLVKVYDPLPAWIKQELQLGINISDTIKIEVKQKQLYQTERTRQNQIDKYVQEIINSKNNTKANE
ncbi:hypothetical protein TTHERM_000947372 (macronuclear) [Tetrahymena thermophila SB210]|uniref:DUF7932 domain-containing protein n=1 Tax=Tetrahymena thermophila (strain SB210) TaxID=312017 RepID=W7XDI0_TETTS|nr:hypothetical protein TTHERM_000947372 [Tetrahymena thermophila SB210]EWS71891.1 hypothetical protein TTHERM_000947372 [Tetrahymena thermophila SB210]|eukprot:XP_012655569.1 hypothetical protein TTHERM_000947372 [Tetrahymena thermophila SB210]